MPDQVRRQFLSGFRVTSLGTLASRVLGMIRDIATAALLGMSGGGVMDAFVLAFRVPNLFRRLFGEGALTASYLPILADKLQQDRAGAQKLVGATLLVLTLTLTALVLLGEAVFGLAWLLVDLTPQVGLLLGLSATLLPYVITICLTAQLAGTLHALRHFTTPALTPLLLNICWLIAVCLIAPWVTADKHAQAYILAAAVLVAGVLQMSLQMIALRQLGFRFQLDWQASRADLWRIAVGMGPAMIGLGITQLNTLMDSLIAWGLAASSDGPESIAWLGGMDYPMRPGAVAALYYSERLYMFPLGLVGVSVATVIFPLLSRHAARGDLDRVGADLTLGLRFVLLLAVPAGVGLVLLAEPIARLLLERGQFTPEDTRRTARLIGCYGTGVWAFCALPVVVRGYYALGDRLTPVKVGVLIVVLNLALNLCLIWPLAEAGLAVATTVSGAVQAVALTVMFSRCHCRLDWWPLAITAARAVTAAGLMALCGLVVLWAIPHEPGLAGRLAEVLMPLAACVWSYFAAIGLLGRAELGLLADRPIN